jgi:hypothetical protein
MLLSSSGGDSGLNPGFLNPDSQRLQGFCRRIKGLQAPPLVWRMKVLMDGMCRRG